MDDTNDRIQRGKFAADWIRQFGLKAWLESEGEFLEEDIRCLFLYLNSEMVRND